jgi:hypothetical protein
MRSPDVRLGSETVLTAPKRHFRSTPNNGRHQTGPVGPVGANRRHWTRRLKLKRPPAEAAYFIVNWKTDSPKRILGACQKPPWVIIDPVNAARFMTAASTLQRRARSAALNAPYAVKPSRIGTPRGFLDIDSLPVQLRMPND